MTITILLILILIFISGILSGSETAFFHIKSHRNNITNNIKKLLKDPQRLLATFLTGNTIVNIALASVSALITKNIALRYDFDLSIAIFFQVLIVTVIILIFGEIFPKIIAIRNSELFAKKSYYLIKILEFIFSPISIIFYSITNFFLKLFKIRYISYINK